MTMAEHFTSDGIILDDALPYWIHRVYQAMRNEMFRAFRQHGEEITPEQWIVLVRLWEADGRTQTELGASTYRDRPTMSRILDLMEKRDFIVRRTDPEHGRVWRVYLTPTGKAMRRRLVPIARKLAEKTLDGISKRDLATTRRALRKMFENVAGE